LKDNNGFVTRLSHGGLRTSIQNKSKQTNGHTDKRTHRQTDTQTNGHTDKRTHRQTDKQANKQTDRQTDKQTNKQTGKQRRGTRVLLKCTFDLI
jgi:hypothetical protein